MFLCIFYSLKNCDNAGEVSSFIGMNAVIAFFLSMYFFKNHGQSFNFAEKISNAVYNFRNMFATLFR